MEIRLLGPVEVVVEGRPVELGGAKQRALLAILALHANHVVPASRLIDDLWPDQPPDSAANTLQGYVSRLRKALNANGAIAHRSAGYVLAAGDDEVDARKFEHLVSRAEEQLAAGAAADAAASLRDALGLWRGPPLADFTDEPFAQSAIARLDELRQKAIADHADAELARGRHAALIPELEAGVAEHPLRERLAAQLMLALYRSGRQAEALEAYRALRRRLDGALGVEPTAATRQLERAILEQDPDLDPPGHAGAVAAAVRRRFHLRAVAAAFLGVAAVGIGIAVFRGAGTAAPAPAVPVHAHSVAVVDPAANAVVADLRIGGWPRAIASGGGFVWAARTGDDTVIRIDPVNRLVLDSFYATTPLDLAWRRGVAWIADGNSFDGPNPPGGGTVERFDTAHRKLNRIRVGPAAPGNGEQTTIAAGREGVWAGNADDARVYRLDPRTGRVAMTVPDLIQVAGIAVGLGSVWAADPINNVVARIDPQTALVTAWIHVADAPRHIAVGEGAVWVVGDAPVSGVWRIDPKTNRAVVRIPVPARANWVTTGGGSVWVTSHTPGHAGPGSLSRINARSNRRIATIHLGFSPEDVVFANGLVWVVVGPM
jgi:DNA-binding SARP family transcriptional activator/DNA-binding beta-propeller fold protein YncE